MQRKVVKTYEEHFGKIRAQMVPYHQSMQTEDLTDELSARDSFAYRSVVGVCLYLARDKTRLAVPSQGAQWVYEQTNPWSFTETEEADWVLEGHSRLLCRLGATYCLVKENGGRQISSGCLKASQMQAGHRIRDIVVQQAAESTWFAVHLHMVPPEPKRWSPLSSCESELHAMASTYVRRHLFAPLSGVHYRGNHRALPLYRQ